MSPLDDRRSAALALARAGRPVFPLQPGTKEPFAGTRGFYDATTDPEAIEAWWGSTPSANIGMPTGAASGVFVLDPDRVEALDELPDELPSTRTVKTPRGGRHLYFQHKAGIRNRTAIVPGLDCRGEGGYVVVPPSDGYEVIDSAEVAEAPRWLLELIKGKPQEQTKPSRRSERPRSKVGDRIPEGERNQTLFFMGLDLKDQGLSHAEVLERIAETNAARCAPPLEQAEIEKIAKSASGYPVRSGRPTPETTEAVREMIRAWWEYRWRGLGGQSDRDVLRVLLELALRYGRLNADGSVDISASVRALSLASAVSSVTVSKGCTRRLEADGWISKIPASNPAHSATWRLRVPLQVLNTRQGGAGGAGVFKSCNALPEETPAWRHRGLVKKGSGGVEALLEMHGPSTSEELRELMGWRGNARVLEHRHLRLLEDRGLAEQREDGRWALVEDHAEAAERIKAQPYAVLLRCERWEWDPLAETWSWLPDEYGAARSEDDRYEEDAAKHERQREDFRAELAVREIEPEDQGETFEEAAPATEHMLAASRAGRYLLARGWQRITRREWASPKTGEVMAVDAAMEEELEGTG